MSLLLAIIADVILFGLFRVLLFAFQEKGISAGALCGLSKVSFIHAQMGD
jgi:hypothetical protein